VKKTSTLMLTTKSKNMDCKTANYSCFALERSAPSRRTSIRLFWLPEKNNSPSENIIILILLLLLY